MRPKWWAWAVVLALPLVAGQIGARGPHALELNLGPGDGPYIRGFAPYYEIDDKVATHWTTYHADIALPVAIDGTATLVYRSARMFVETAQVEVAFDGRPVDRYEARGGTFVDRSVDLGLLSGAPVRVRFDADSHERRDQGLKLDWVRLELGPDARVHLTGLARLRPAVLLLIVLALLAVSGWTIGISALLAAPLSIALAGGLLFDPWLTHRLLTAVPETLLAVAVIGLLVGRWLAARGVTTATTLRTLAALCVLAFLIRSAAVNHPRFYYPDLRTHARLVQILQIAGLDFFRVPSRYIWQHGVWRTEAYGQTYAFPYTPAFHLPFAAAGLDYDALITAIKMGGVVVSLVPLILVWVMARRVGASPLGAALMVVIPTYTSRLSFAFLPALFGHAVDMAFFAWLLARLARFPAARTFAVGVACVVACQLAYISGVTNISLFLFVLALVEPQGTARERLKRGGLILAMGLVASVLSVALYYRDFLGMVTDMLPRIGGAHGAVSRYPIESWIQTVYARTRGFFGLVYPPLVAAGLYLLRRCPGHRILWAWGFTYLLLLLGRAKVPDVFLHGHETLLVTPLVCLAAGESIAWLWARPVWGRWVAAAIAAFLAAQGLVWQWRAIADQLANAL